MVAKKIKKKKNNFFINIFYGGNGVFINFIYNFFISMKDGLSFSKFWNILKFVVRYKLIAGILFLQTSSVMVFIFGDSEFFQLFSYFLVFHYLFFVFINILLFIKENSINWVDFFIFLLDISKYDLLFSVVVQQMWYLNIIKSGLK